MYHPPPAHDEIRYELTLEPPVETIYDLKPRLRMMRDQARKHFTVVRLSTPYRLASGYNC
jgi:hypothetical protein